MKDKLNKDIELIEYFGGVSKTAALCGVSKSAVSQWKNNGIPRAWRSFLSLKKTKRLK